MSLLVVVFAVVDHAPSFDGLNKKQISGAQVARYVNLYNMYMYVGMYVDGRVYLQ